MSEHPGKAALADIETGIFGNGNIVQETAPIEITGGQFRALTSYVSDLERRLEASEQRSNRRYGDALALRARLEKAEAEREAAYLAGFMASGEGYNGEYPFEFANIEDDADWLKMRDRDLLALKSTTPDQGDEA